MISIPRLLLAVFFAIAYGAIAGYWLGALVCMCR